MKRDLMNEAGIKVTLDIAIGPASTWLRHKFSSIDVVDAAKELIHTGALNFFPEQPLRRRFRTTIIILK